MTTHSDYNSDGAGEPEEEGHEEFDQFDEYIQEGLKGDPRLESGVPDSAWGSDLDFIQMSGLDSRPPGEGMSKPPAEEPQVADVDASKPLSFFEKGVADVDNDMVPGMTNDGDREVREGVPISDSRAVMEHVRDMIAELTRDEKPSPPPEPEVVLPAASVEEEAPSAMPEPKLGGTPVSSRAEFEREAAE